MLYFIFWVLFILAVLLAVPVVAHLENRARRPAKEDESVEDEDAEEALVDGDDAEAEAVEEEFGDPLQA